MQNLTESVPTAPPIRDVIDEAAAVEAILNPKPPEQGEQVTPPGGDPQGAGEQAETPKPSQIDYETPVPMPNGEPVTIGALKDAYQQQEKRLLDVQKRESELLARHTELQEFASYVENLPPELVESVKAQQERHLREQHDLMLEALPEWRDADKLKAGRDRIVAMAQEYGIAELIKGVSDHRVVKFLNDVAELRELVAKGREKLATKAPEKPAGKAPETSGTAELERLKARAKAGDEQAQVAYIDKLRGIRK